MRSGSASHLYEGSNRRGRSVRTEVTEGLAGWKESVGQDSLAEEAKVGVV